jgi:hypothetical protein
MEEEQKGDCRTSEEISEILYKSLDRKSNTYKGKKYDSSFYYADALKCVLRKNVGKGENE